MTHPLHIPQPAHTALDVLDRAGFSAWLVGGFVRDALRGIEAHDVDIATNARWEKVRQLFKEQGFAVHETGTKHGTVTVMVDGWPLEITTFRAEGTYSDARHPDSVRFVQDVQTDLARRDFTMNALAYHPDKGFVDPFGGTEDIRNGVIRCVGNPTARFAEDALRIMRAARFCSQLGFSIHPDTLSAMHTQVQGLNHVARERIQDELGRFLLGPHIQDALPPCLPVISAVIPELFQPHSQASFSRSLSTQTIHAAARAVEYAPRVESCRYAALWLAFEQQGFADEDTDDRAHHALRNLRVKKAVTDQAALLIRLCQAELRPEKHCVHRLALQARGDVCVMRWQFAIRRALLPNSYPNRKRQEELLDTCQGIFEELVASNAPFSVKDLALSGADVVNLGVQPGPAIGEALHVLLESCVDGKVQNSPSHLALYLHGLPFEK